MKSTISSKRQIVRIVPPDPVCSSTLDSIRQNPKFARLLWFSINTQYELLRRLNPKHRINAYFIIQERGHVNLIQALVYHRKNEAVVCSVIQCLLRLINTNKQFTDEYCYKIIEAGAPQALHDLISTASIHAESMKLAMPLIAQLAASRSNVQCLIEAGLMQDCVDIIKDPKISQETSREAVETLLRFIHYPQARTELIHPVFIKNIIELLEQKIKDRYSILAGLKILAAVVITNEGYELLKADYVGIRLIVKILENHPQDQVINEISATILEKLAAIEDIERALAAVKAGNTGQIALLSSLLLVNDLLKYVVQKGGILELILIIENQLNKNEPESLQLVRSCITALGRIATNETRYIHEIIKNNGLEVINKACQKESPELLLACCDTVEKLAFDESVTEIIIAKETIKALLGRVETIKKSENVGAAIIETLILFGKHSAGRVEIEVQEGPKKYLKVMKEYKDNKEIQESGFKAIAKLITYSSTATTLIEEDIINHINTIAKAHNEWKKVHFYSVKVIELLIQLGLTSQKLEKNKVFETIIHIATTGITEDDSYQPIKAADQPTVNTERDDIIKAEERLTEYQEFEMRNSAIVILESITVLEEMDTLKGILEDTSQAFSINGTANSGKTLQQLRLFATVALIPKIAHYLLTSDIPEKIAWNAKLATYHPAFPGRSDIVRTCIMFFEHLTHHHIHHESIRKLLAQDTVKHAALATITNALHRDPEERTVLQAIKGLFSLITNRVLEPADKFTFESETRIGFKEASAERVIGAVISAIKKFEEEKVQSAGITLLIAAINTDKGYIPLILSQGGTRLAISHLENINTSLEAGRLNMELISSMGRDPEALNLLKNQHAAHAILFFLESNHNPDDVAKSAAPLLQTLSFELTEQDLIEIIEILKLGVNEDDRLALVDTFEHLANLTLLDKNNNLLIKEKAPHALLTLLEKELTANIDTLLEQGVLELHKRILVALLSALSRMRTTQPQLDKDLVQHGLFKSLEKIIKERSDLTNPVAAALLLLSQLILDKQVSNELVKNCAEADFVPTLVGFLESYNGHQTIMNNSIEILLAISSKYPDLTTRMSEKNFVRALIRETAIAVKLGKDDQNALAVANQNFRCLVGLAENPNALRAMAEGGGEDLAVSVVEKYIRKSKQGQAKRERAASIRPGQVLMEIAAAIGTQHSVIDTLIASALELLDKILNIPIGQRAVVNASLGRELVNVLEDNNDPIMVLSALKIIEKASRHEQLVADLSETTSLMKIMKAATAIPNNAEVERIIGIILANLGSNSMIPIIAEQVIDYSQKLNYNDVETVEPYLSALNYYANLLSGPKNSKIEGNTGIRVYEAIQVTLQTSKTNPPLLLAHLRVIERLVSREPEIRYSVRRSPIADLLAQILSTVKADVQTKQITQILTKAAKEITRHEERNEIVLDGTTGVRKQVRVENHDGFITGLLQNNMQPIKSLIEVLDQIAKRSEQEQVNQDSLANILTILNEVVRESEQARAEVIKLNGLAIVAQIYLNRIASYAHREEAREALRLLSVLTDSKNSYSTIATEALVERLLKDISQPEFEILLADDDVPVITEAGLSLLQRLTDIEHDHTLLKEKGCIETVIAIIESFKATCKPALGAKRLSPGVLRVCKAGSQAMRALKSMLHDPVLAKAAVKLQAKESTIGVLNILAGALAGSLEIDSESVRGLQDIVSSQNHFNRFIEDTLGVLEVLAAHLRHEKMIDILGEDRVMYQNLLNIVSKVPDEVLLTYRALGVFKHSLQHLGKKRILANKESLVPVVELTDMIFNLYTNIPLIVALTDEVKSLAVNGLTLKELENKKADLDSIERARKDFVVLANIIEDLVPKEVDRSIDEDERVKLVEVLNILKEVADDEERASRIAQHELFFLLAEILFHSHVELVLKEAVIEVFNKLSRYSEQCLKLSTSTHVIHGHAAYILEVGVQVLSSSVPDKSYEVSQVIAAIETLERLIEVAKLLFQLPKDVNLDAVTAAVCQVAEPACVREDITIISSVIRILAMLSILYEPAATIIQGTGATARIMKRAETSIHDLKFARNFALFIASTATTPERRTEYANHGVFDKLFTAVKKNFDDLDLSLATCMAYTSMVTGHHENGKFFLNSTYSVECLEYLVAKYHSEGSVVETISRLLNTLASHNPDNARRLAELGATRWIGEFFNHFNERTQDVTVIECLKTVNTLNTSKENASRLMDKGFISTLIRYITKHGSSPMVGILAMSAIGHLAAQTETARVYKAIEDGAIEAIVRIANSHQTDKTILLAALDNLKLFKKDAKCSQQLSQRGAIDMILRILTTQDYDTDLVLKALNLFDEIIVGEEAINATLDSEIVGILNGLLTTQRTAPEVLDTVFRLFAKLAIDPDHSLKVYQTGFLQAALKCVEGHAIRPSTSFELFKTLYKLSYNEDVALFIGETSTATILKQIELNINNKIIVETGTRLLVNLLENETAAQIAVSYRGVNIMNALITTHPSDEVVTLQAYHALALLALNSDRVRADILRTTIKANIENLHKSFSSANKAEPTKEALLALESIERALIVNEERKGMKFEEEESPELKPQPKPQPQPQPQLQPQPQPQPTIVYKEKQVEPEKIEFMAELNKSTSSQSSQPEEQKSPSPVYSKQESINASMSSSYNNSMERRNERLVYLKNDPNMKEAWQYLFRGKILKMWTPHGTNWPMHLLLSDDGYSLTLKGKKKWETTVRLDDIEGIWKGYFSNSPFTKPKKLFTKSPEQDYCFFFVTRPASDGTVKTLYFECQALDERERFVDSLTQILKRLIQLQKEMR